MVRKFYLTGLALFSIYIACAQSFYWGYPFRLDNETEMDSRHIVDENIYRLLSRYDLGIFNYAISATEIDAQDLEVIGGSDLGLVSPTMRTAEKTHHSMFEKDGVDFIYFSNETDRESNENNLYWQDVNIKTGDKSDFKLVSKLVAKSVSNSGKFLTAKSPDGAYYAVLKEAAFEKKTLEKIEIELYDKSFVQVASLSHEFEWEADRVPKHELHVSNNGDVYFLKNIDLKKMKPYMLAYSWKKGSDALMTYDLKQADDYQISRPYAYFIDDGFYVAGILTHEGSTTFGLSVDMDGRHSGTSGSALLVIKFEAGDMVYQTRSSFDGIISNVSIKIVLPEGQNQYVVMQRFVEDKKSSTTDLTSNNITYDYSYLNNGFLISFLDSNTGKIQWNHSIATKEPNTRNDNGAYLSVLPVLHQGNLVLFYNETRDIPGGYSRRFPIKEVINPQGDSVSREALLSAGVGVKKDEYFDLDTEFIVPVADNKFLVRARSDDQFKYGYLQF